MCNHNSVPLLSNPIPWCTRAHQIPQWQHNYIPINLLAIHFFLTSVGGIIKFELLEYPQASDLFLRSHSSKTNCLIYNPEGLSKSNLNFCCHVSSNECLTNIIYHEQWQYKLTCIILQHCYKILCAHTNKMKEFTM